MATSITVAYGDGIGPEIMEATLRILEEAGAQLEIESIDIGEKVYLSGEPTGMSASAWESLKRTRVFLKAPITTPQGGGYRSLNVSIRGALGLYANVRPAVSYHPYIATKHPKMDVVIIRENVEDLYTGIEYRPTPDTCTAIKLITRPGSEKIIRFAFEYARRMGRKKVTAFTKDNILKLTDGLFHRCFDLIAAEYPEIATEHWIVDIGAAKLADTPEAFDLLVLPNLYGDILSDVAAQITGSVGLGGSANIGERGAMFEAIHGSAPRRAGQNAANPSGLLHAAILMCLHLHQTKVAERIHNAWLRTIEEGIHTQDIYKEGSSKQRVGTREFATAIIERLGKQPEYLKAVSYPAPTETWAHHGTTPATAQRELIGVDLYIYTHDSVERLQKKLEDAFVPSLPLKKISNRGTSVWPETPEIECTDHFRCRFLAACSIKPQLIAALLHRLADLGVDVTTAECLYTYEGKAGFSS
jgi:isocitrate dehydrogenase